MVSEQKVNTAPRRVCLDNHEIFHRPYDSHLLFFKDEMEKAKSTKIGAAETASECGQSFNCKTNFAQNRSGIELLS